MSRARIRASLKELLAILFFLDSMKKTDGWFLLEEPEKKTRTVVLFLSG